jgi:hypothetical protein
MIDTADRAEILHLLSELERSWCRLDFDHLRSLWDPECEPVYVAEEHPRVQLSWPQLQEYFDLTARAIGRMSMRIEGEPALRELAPGLVSAAYAMHWDAEVRGETRPMGGDNRVVDTFRRTPAGWRFVQHVEAPLAPISYVRELYARSVTPGF